MNVFYKPTALLYSFIIKMGWSGEYFHKANIFINPPDAGYNPFTFSVPNPLILVKTLSSFLCKLTNFGKILLLSHINRLILIETLRLFIYKSTGFR